MSTVRFRPSFTLDIAVDAELAMERLRQLVENEEKGLEGRFARQQAMLFFRAMKRHFWSPWLHLEIRNEDGHEQLFGRFSPHPSIWTAIIFSYLSLAVLFFFNLVFAVSQVMAGQYAGSTWLIPVWCLLAIAIWAGAQVGQKLARKEMDRLQLMIHDLFQVEKGGIHSSVEE